MPLPSTLQTSVKPCNIAGGISSFQQKNVSLILGSFTDFEALFPVVSMDLQKFKKSVEGYTSKLVVFNHVGSC